MLNQSVTKKHKILAKISCPLIKRKKKKLHGPIPDDKDRSWEISIETSVRFPWTTPEASMWK